ncbi:ribosome biogenesis GTP-binding protein YihA/YsxC [[Mycoplasma] mobile]|uniref:Probable GTP-binding protein EngB n=1 Tax=Mycoplasma mobile (strain ATCC 43663 / 163K / NCTC 11711) TaxID=267748 RepID=ENGB_MYCM1|nr:ribosome biogenesis GTP-binding protein YihA/YsxC [[Mycoplasma] mobile]Q6KHV1.1 RecName: Full=Probable GTP-binding protein EngB [Mycoplasma mobile 163K]AAT27826.1 GTP-binding protein [Mycoplasma mobile 163K]
MLKFIKSSTKESEWLKNPKNEICFVGRSNVGKSSLINALFKTRVVKVGKTPGKTKLINFFEDERGNSVVDLPGYGYAKLSKEAQSEISDMIFEFLTKRVEIKKLFLLIDSRLGFTPIDQEFYDFLKEAPFEIIIVATKRDKLNQSQTYQIKKSLDELKVKYFLVSITKKEFLQDLVNNLFN